MAFLLRKFKFSPFLPNQAFRNTMTDFAVVISILIWSLIGNAFADVPVEKLNVPSKFAPTFQCCDASCTTSWPTECYGQEAPYGPRPWVVNLSDLNGKSWVPFMAAGPALLAFVLVFLDDGITCRSLIVLYCSHYHFTQKYSQYSSLQGILSTIQAISSNTAMLIM